MAGKKERELAIAKKLVAENEHLLPRLRGSEKKRLAELAETQGLDLEELEKEAMEEIRKSKKTKAFGGEKKRLRVRVDGGVEEIVDTVHRIEEEDEDDDDDDIEME